MQLEYDLITLYETSIRSIIMTKKNVLQLVLIIGFPASVMLPGCTQKSQYHQVISLAGTWNFQLDSTNRGIKEQWYNHKLSETIQLPGTTDEAGYGLKTSGSDYGGLTREFKYNGPAWYQKEIIIPEKWKEKDVTLFLERVIWESHVFIDGREMDIQDALNTPHIHHIGKLLPGKHLLSVRVNNDMIHNIGDNGHAYYEYTQSIWNGMVGRLELRASDPLYIKQVRVLPDPDNDRLRVDVFLNKSSSRISINELVFKISEPVIPRAGSRTGKRYF